MSTFDHKSGVRQSIEGAAIYYEQQGPVQGEPLLLLHGGMGSIDDFRAIAPLLQPHHRLIGIDSRGHGASTRGAKPLSYQQLENDAARIIEQLKLDRFDLLGFSDGGTVGYLKWTPKTGR